MSIQSIYKYTKHIQYFVDKIKITLLEINHKLIIEGYNENNTIPISHLSPRYPVLHPLGQPPFKGEHVSSNLQFPEQRLLQFLPYELTHSATKKVL